MGRQLLISDLQPFLNDGKTFARDKCEGNLPCSKDWLTRAARRGDSSRLNVFTITFLIKSSPELFLLQIELMRSEISSDFN